METPCPEISLYPERISSEKYLDTKIAEIKAAAEGKGCIELSKSEKEDLLIEEQALGEELESYFKLNPRSLSLRLSFLRSEEGKEHLAKIIGSAEIPEDEDGLRMLLFENADSFRALSGVQRKTLEGASKEYEEKSRFEQLIKGAKDDGSLEISGVEVSESIGLKLDPEKSLQKITGYRALKKRG